MFYKIPQLLFQDFEEVSGRNYSNSDTKHIETLALIIGEESGSKIIANGLIYPDQDGHSYHVTSKDTLDGVEVLEKIGFGQKVVGWIHSHVRGEKCFFSGLDIHIQYSSQKTNSNFLGIVMKINKIGQYDDHKFYKLTDLRMKIVNDCLENHTGHNSCGENDLELYQCMSSYVSLILDIPLTIFISQQFQSVASRVRNSRKRKIAQLESIIQTNSEGQSNNHDEEKFEDDDSTAEICKVCKKQCQSILNHLARPKSKCKTRYSKEELDELKNKAKDRKQEKKREARKKGKSNKPEKSREICKACNRQFINLLLHLSQSECLQEYNEEDYESLLEKSIQKKKSYQKSYQEEYRKRLYVQKENRTSDDRIVLFKRSIKDGPKHICNSCDRKLFRDSVHLLTSKTLANLIKKCSEEFLSHALRGIEINKEDPAITLCHNCHDNLRKGKIPSISVLNGLELDEVPPELQVTDLEQQLFSKNILFEKITELPRSRMKAIHDIVVNVPLYDQDITNTIKILPRPIDKANIIEMRLKRKVEYKSVYSASYIRPNVPYNAVVKLKELGNPHYADIVLPDKEIEIMETNDCIKEEDTEKMEVDDENDVLSDEENEGFGTNADSLRNAPTFLAPEHPELGIIVNETGKTKTLEDVPTISIAPGEGKKPETFLRDSHFETKAFPRHFPSGNFGLHHERAIPLTSRMYFVQRLMNKDPRFSKDLSYLFMAQQFCERQSLEKQIHIAGRKGKFQGPGSSGKKIHLDDKFNVFQKIPGTPTYWQQAKSELISKVYALGPFQGFFTLSCGEMRWFEVFVSVLKELDHKVEYVGGDKWDGDEEKIIVDDQYRLWDFVDNIMNKTKHELLKDFCYLVTLHFDSRVKNFIKHILLGSGKERLPISHYSYRIEIQIRGMPHLHGVFWLDKTWLMEMFGITGPLSENDHEKVVKLADYMISCKIPDNDEKLKKIVEEVQTHRHTKSCQKYGTECRYNFDRYPSKRTIIASPIAETLNEEEREKKYEKAKEILSSARKIMKENDMSEITFEEFISKICDGSITDDEYHDALETMKRGHMIIMKRDTNACKINNYNGEMLTAWNANMDIQLAYDHYAIISYICNYITKGEAGMTKLLRDALNEARDKPHDEQLRRLNFEYLTNRQKGGPESIYTLLKGMSLKKSDLACKFVISGFPENRSLFYIPVKEDDDFRDEDDDSDDSDDEEREFHEFGTSKEIEIDGKEGKFKASMSVIDRYVARPKSLENLSLVQFATNYYPCKKPEGKSELNHDEVKEEDIASSNYFEKLPKFIQLAGALGKKYMKLRLFPAVARVHVSSKKDGYEKFYSEMVLFTPWRNESKELHSESAEACLEEYSKRLAKIDSIKGIIFPGEKALDITDINPSDLEDSRPQHVFDTLNAQGEQQNDDDVDEGQRDDPDSVFMRWHGENEENPNSNAQFESARYKKIKHLPDDGLVSITRQLVQEQRDALTHILNFCKDTVKARTNLDMKINQLLLIIHGGAGVGKSRTIMALSQWADKILRKVGDDSIKPRVLLCAFTGKAASLIDGITIHSAFGFVPDRSNEKKHKILSDKRMAEFRHNMSDLKLIIIDEISLVGADMLFQIHMRLCDIFQKNPKKHPFAGIGVVFVGDLMQLHPVKQKLVFVEPRDDQFKQFFHSFNLWAMFTPHILTHNHRQGEGAEWSNALNRFRVATHTDSDIELLKGRITKEKINEQTATHVCYTRKEVSDHNDDMIEAINFPEVIIECINKPPKGEKKDWKPPLNNDGHTIADTGFELNLLLKIGVRVTLNTNIDTLDGLVNGNSGTVIGYELKPDGKVDAVIVRFDQDDWGKDQRERYKYYSEKYKSQNGTPIKKHLLEYSPWRKDMRRAELFQFPLNHGYSSTSHKMQGRTVKTGSKLVIHWNRWFSSKNCYGMAYVCLGRCEKLEDIYIVGDFDPAGINCCPISLEESNRLNEKFEKTKEIKESMYTDCFTISYLNVSRMLPHKEDILLDTWVMKADIISFGETWLKPEEELCFKNQGYIGVQTNTQNANGKGLATFIKEHYGADWKKVSKEKFSAILTQTEAVDVITLYLSKDFDWKELHQLLEEWVVEIRDTVIIGDTNINYLKKSHEFIKYLEEKSFTQLVDRPTHACGGLIDHIYISKSLLEKNPYFTQRSVYYSDHDEIVLHIPK